MPRYDYKCPVCGNVEEHEHSIKEDPTIICENKIPERDNIICGTEMKRVPCSTAFKLKGLGWARDGYSKN